MGEEINTAVFQSQIDLLDVLYKCLLRTDSLNRSPLGYYKLQSQKGFLFIKVLSFSAVDHSRIRLQLGANDYINASLISVDEAQRSYILTQVCTLWLLYSGLEGCESKLLSICQEITAILLGSECPTSNLERQQQHSDNKHPNMTNNRRGYFIYLSFI